MAWKWGIRLTAHVEALVCDRGRPFRLEEIYTHISEFVESALKHLAVLVEAEPSNHNLSIKIPLSLLHHTHPIPRLWFGDAAAAQRVVSPTGVKWFFNLTPTGLPKWDCDRIGNQVHKRYQS